MTSAPSSTPPRGKWQFSLRNMLWAAVAISLLFGPAAYLGWPGMIVAGLLAIPVALCLLLNYTPKLVEILVFLAIAAILFAILLPTTIETRTPAWRNVCMNHLMQIALAMHLYHDAHGHFPPAYVADARGVPMHSWRVLLLPFLEESKAYDNYRWDEPWNSTHNAQLGVDPYLFQCPSDGAAAASGMTSYVLVTGRGTAFDDDQTTTIDDLRDGTWQTILIVEVANSGIHWMEPRDLNVQQMAPTINANAGQGISSAHRSGAIVAFADSHVSFLPETIPAADLQGLLTIHGRENVDMSDY